MPSYVTPKRGAAFIFYTALTSQANTKLVKANPTLAAGDVKVSIDGGAFNNLTTLPDAEPDASAAVRVRLSADEMDGDNIVVVFSDAAGAEWCDQVWTIQTTARQIDDLAVPGSAMTLVNDAITAAKFDETTAFPLAAADAGATAVARPGNAMTLTAGERTSVADAVWDRLTSAMTTVGSIGKAFMDFIAYAMGKLGLIQPNIITISALVVDGIHADSTPIRMYQGTDHTVTFLVIDALGDPVDLTGLNTDIRFELATPTRIIKDLDDLNILLGPEVNRGTFTIGAAETRAFDVTGTRPYDYELRVKTPAVGEQVQARGLFYITEALIEDLSPPAGP